MALTTCGKIGIIHIRLLNTLSTHTEQRPWLVLLATSPVRAEHRLQQQNMQEEKDDHPAPFQLFVPYTAMQPNSSEDQPHDEELSLRSALRRYVFVNGNEHLLESLMTEWNRLFADKLYFMKNGAGNNARIKQSDMDRLRKACLGNSNEIGLPVSIGNVKPGQRISLVNTPFEKEDCEYEVVSVKKKSGGIVELQVKMKLFSIDFDHITITYCDTDDCSSNAELVSSSQRKLLDILRRRVNRKGTPITEYEDQKTLNDIFSHHDTLFPEGAMKRHFLALMLICAHLQNDETSVGNYREAVEKELDKISHICESKAATDTRAYLHVALYIATGEAKYREQAKAYVRKYNPSSLYLRKFISTMSKREASRFLGPKARKKYKNALPDRER